MAVQVEEPAPGFESRLIRPTSPLLALRHWAASYCRSTDVHGFKYITLPHQMWIERACWAALLVAGMLVTLYLVQIAWQGYLSTPVLIAVETSQFPIWKIPFPAVTLCSLNKVEVTAANELIDSWRLPPNASKEQLLEDLHLVPGLSNPPTVAPSTQPLERLQSALELNNVSISELVLKVAPRCEDLLWRCRFKGRVRPCGELFIALRCREGVCCTFNYFGARGGIGDLAALEPEAAWRGDPREGDKERPVRTSACGAVMGLEVLLRARTAEYHTTVLASHGFKVLVHEARDYPGGGTPAWLLSPRRALLVSLAPQVMASTRRAQAAGQGARGCWTPRERPLPFLRTYTLHNCASECRRNRSLTVCGCVPPHYPRNAHERVCDLRDMPCLCRLSGKPEEDPGQQRSQRVEEVETVIGGDSVVLQGLNSEEPQCGCQPECDHVSYSADLSESDLTREVPAAEEDFFDGVHDTSDFSLLSVFFVDLVGTKYRRDTYYTWRQLLASVGGLLSLGLGVSLVSGFELLYFFTLRALCHLACVSRRRPRRPRLTLLPPPLRPALPPVTAGASVSPGIPAAATAATASRPRHSVVRGRIVASRSVTTVTPVASPENAYGSRWPP